MYCMSFPASHGYVSLVPAHLLPAVGTRVNKDVEVVHEERDQAAAAPQAEKKPKFVNQIY